MLEERKEAVRRKLKEVRTSTLELARQLDQDDWTHRVHAHDDSWTALELLRHLVWAEGGMLRLIKQIRQGGEGTSDDFDLARYNAAGVRKLGDKMPADLMELMDRNRHELLQLVDELNESEWQLQGRHATMGMASIERILYEIANHEQEHLNDLRRALQLTQEP